MRAVRLPEGVAEEIAAHLSLHGTSQTLFVLALRSHFVLAGDPLPMQRFDFIGSFGMEHDCQSASKRDPLSARKRDPLSGLRTVDVTRFLALRAA